MAIEQPGARDVHVDKLLTSISVAYKNPNYIADQVFPTLMVEKQSDIIPVYPKADWLRDVMQPYVPGGEGATSGYSVDTSKTYFAKGWKLRKLIPDDVINNADEPFNMIRDATAWLQEQAQLRWEVEFAENHFATGVWTGDKIGGTDFIQWSDSLSNPIQTIRDFADQIRQRTGAIANTLVMGQQVWNKLVDHAVIVDRLKYTSRESLTPDMLARLIGIERILIGSAVRVTSGEGAATTTVTDIFGKHALLLSVASRPSLYTPSAGYIFVWRPITNTPFYFRRLRNEERETEILEIKSFFDIRQIDPDLGLFMQNAVA